MNLVMSDITRNKLGCYMAQQASLNNIPVSALVSRFTVEPSVQQRFENAVKESTEFTKKINVFGVTDQKGEKILLDTTGPIARTNTSYDGTKRRKWMFKDGAVVKRIYTADEQQQQAESQKAALLSEAENVIQPLERAVRLNMATDEERARLESWERYSVLVSRVDTTKPEWPQKPE